jgi:hypothetical protein
MISGDIYLQYCVQVSKSYVKGNFCDISEHFVLCKNMKKLCTDIHSVWHKARGKVAVNAA